MRSRIDNVATGLLIAACLCVIATSIDNAAILRRLAAHRAGPRGFTQGQALIGVAGGDFARANHTVVLFIRRDCRFCIDSLPFYRRLGATAVHHSGLLRIVAASTEVATGLGAYLRTQGIEVDATVTVSSSALVTGATPTVVLVDPRGVIEGSWVGRQGGKGEAEIIARASH